MRQAAGRYHLEPPQSSPKHRLLNSSVDAFQTQIRSILFFGEAQSYRKAHPKSHHKPHRNNSLLIQSMDAFQVQIRSTLFFSHPGFRFFLIRPLRKIRIIHDLTMLLSCISFECATLEKYFISLFFLS